jgi:hypothetical protein
MSLTECRECGKSISSEAASCPQCGCPMKEGGGEPQFAAFRKRWLMAGLVIGAIWVPIGIAVNMPVVSVIALVGMVFAGAKLALMNKQRPDGR